MSNKIIASRTDEESGFSSITIQNKYGKFFGWSQCHPEDMNNFSVYAGERYAQIRAAAEFAKFRYKQEKIKLQTIQNLIKDIEYDPGLSMAYLPSKVRRKINIKLRDYTQSVEDWKNLYSYLKEDITKLDTERQDLLEKYRNKHKGN